MTHYKKECLASTGKLDKELPSPISSCPCDWARVASQVPPLARWFSLPVAVDQFVSRKLRNYFIERGTILGWQSFEALG